MTSEIAELLAEETGRPKSDFTVDLDEYPLPDHSEKTGEYWED